MARTVQSRASTARKPSGYRPPAVLDIPTGLDPSFDYRWVRVRAGSEDDAKNVFKRRREGFEFVKASEVPGYDGPTHPKGGAYDGVVGQVDLALARIPKDVAQARRDYYADQAARQNESVEEDLQRDADPRVHVSRNFKSTTSRGQRETSFAE